MAMENRIRHVPNPQRCSPQSCPRCRQLKAARARCWPQLTNSTLGVMEAV
jgi:hypothetical protein